MKRYELIVIWECNDKNIYTYWSYEKAQKAMDAMKMAFGNQIQWTGIREVNK